MATGRELRTFDDVAVSDFRPNGGAGGVAFSSDGRKLASGGGRKSVKLWDVVAGGELRTFDTDHTIIAVAFSPDGKLLAGVTDEGEVLLWDAETGKALLSVSWHERGISSVAFSPDGRAKIHFTVPGA